MVTLDEVLDEGTALSVLVWTEEGSFAAATACVVLVRGDSDQ